jgi:hypothetical protein
MLLYYLEFRFTIYDIFFVSILRIQCMFWYHTKDTKSIIKLFDRVKRKETE